MSVARTDARAIFDAAIEAVNPAALVCRELRENAELAEAVAKARQIVVVGGGKAGTGMAIGVEEALASQLDRVTGLVNVPNSPVRPTQRIRLNPARPSGCNEPTQAAIEGTELMLNAVSKATNDDLVICLVSGGGSALISAPSNGISLREKILTTGLLTDAGATIADLNCVRKHISRVKGGQLAAANRAGSLWSLMLSDVECDRLDVIASGPTVADPTTFEDALAIASRYRPHATVPRSVMEHLELGNEGQIQETPKQLPDNVHNIVLANNDTALAGAHAEAERRGYRVVRCEPAFCDTTNAARSLLNAVRHALLDGDSPICILRGGEPTVRLPARLGLGGRNQQLVLEVGMSLKEDDLARLTIFCAGTDGEDGPTDAAGAIFDADVVAAAELKLLDGSYFLGRHDAYPFFEQTGGLLKTGLTGTNVMDVHIALIQPKNRS